MAKRTRGKTKEPAAPRKGRAKKAPKEGSFEVEESGAGAGTEHGIETGLALLTLVSLIVGLILMQLRMAEHGAGLFA